MTITLKSIYKLKSPYLPDRKVFVKSYAVFDKYFNDYVFFIRLRKTKPQGKETNETEAADKDRGRQ